MLDKIIHASEARAATFTVLKKQSRGPGNPGAKNIPNYADCITAFDIETTAVSKIENAFMWIWQWHFADPINTTYIGRTWQELTDFVEMLDECLSKQDLTLVVWVHNLSYEYHFLRACWEWDPDKVFAVKSRKPLKATHGRFEYRCSFLQTNMSLKTFCKTYNTPHQKLEMNYNTDRYPWSPVSRDDLQYCVNDVIGLCEAVTARMKMYHDNLYTVPLTSTGYVRRDVKNAMQYYRRGFVNSIAPDYETYCQLKRAFRGGNTHANLAVINKSVEDVTGYDFSASYPARQTQELFPITPFRPINGEFENAGIFESFRKQRKAVLCDISLTGVTLKDPDWPVPYISKSKCENLDTTYPCDNGRVISADYLELAITDIDWEIINSEYTYTSIYIKNVRTSKYGKLPKPIVDTINGYFERKTKLKDVAGGKTEYELLKALLNSIYGMSAQDPCKDLTVWDPNHDPEKEEIWHIKDQTVDDKLKRLRKHNRSAVEPYQWGVWTTAHARRALEDAIKICYEQGTFLYCDTDSVYFMGTVNFDEYNRVAMKKAKKSGSYATDPSGEIHYMGALEFDGHYKQFRTMGAKKYVTVNDSGELKITIAGVDKTTGAAELEANGGIDAFKTGFVFRDGGGTDSTYNDEPYGDYTVDGHTINIGPNVYIGPSTYALGLHEEYCRLLGIPYIEYRQTKNNTL